MMDALIMTLGFEPGPLIRAVAKYPLKERGDIVIFMPTYRDERAERAYTDFEKICKMLIGDRSDVRVSRYEINLEDVSSAILRIRRLLSKYSDKDVAICITGGMRALCILVYIAYLMTPWKRDPVVEVYVENRGFSVMLPPVHKVLEFGLSSEKIQILKVLAEGDKSASEIALLLNKDRSTIYRHLEWLESRGLIEKVERGLFKLSYLGKLMCE